MDLSEPIPALASDNAIETFATDAVAWSPSFPAPMYLDPVVWQLAQLFDGRVTGDELVDDLVAVYGIEAPLAREHVARALLTASGGALLEGIDGPDQGCPADRFLQTIGDP